MPRVALGDPGGNAVVRPDAILHVGCHGERGVIVGVPPDACDTAQNRKAVQASLSRLVPFLFHCAHKRPQRGPGACVRGAGLGGRLIAQFGIGLEARAGRPPDDRGYV
jgi:hypothetical protein